LHAETWCNHPKLVQEICSSKEYKILPKRGNQLLQQQVKMHGCQAPYIRLYKKVCPIFYLFKLVTLPLAHKPNSNKHVEIKLITNRNSKIDFLLQLSFLRLTELK
jgi:hypothetical protein